MSISNSGRGKVVELSRKKTVAGPSGRRVVPINARRKFGNPRPLFAAWDEIEAAVSEATSLVVMSDFDGTLAPIQSQPEQVRLGARVRAALAQLVTKDVLVGIVSGRSLPDVRKRVGLDGICYVGCHGYSFQATHGHPVTLMNRAEEALLPSVGRALKLRLKNLHGIRVEAKEAGLAIHYRNATRRDANRARAAIQDAVKRNRRLHLITGKKVWEILPGPGVDKWTAIRLLLALEDRAKSLLVYIGDDVPDEHVFARMRGISVAVGKRRHTAARFYVETTADVRRFLEELAKAKV
ncbi:MAG: trehalose-phosphatase [Candidatus Acidiferrales bacterium]|jgi:trehalose 6-phosphate phosphatase